MDRGSSVGGGSVADEFRERVKGRRVITDFLVYGFVAGLLILIIVMLAITPNPAWMSGDPDESAVGALHPYEVQRGRIHQLVQVPAGSLNQDQVKHITEVQPRWHPLLPCARDPVCQAVCTPVCHRSATGLPPGVPRQPNQTHILSSHHPC